MNFAPQKFFIGLMDFFSIFQPSALLTWLLMDAVDPAVLGIGQGGREKTNRYCEEESHEVHIVKKGVWATGQRGVSRLGRRE